MSLDDLGVDWASPASAVLLIAAADEAALEHYRGLFSGWGYEVHTARGGLECLARLRESLPDVLVLDQELLWGGSDGVLAWLHEERTAPAIPIVLLTPAALSEPVRAAAPIRCLHKPVDVSALLDAVRSFVGCLPAGHP
jgi:CheY-like chemotaxis protein